MNQEIMRKIDSLPPLPETILAINEFKKSEDKSPKKLVDIIEKDPLILSTLLKITNSPMFGFKKKITTAQMAINLVGVNFAISVAISSSVKELIQTNLDSYGVKVERFLHTSNNASVFMTHWSKSLSSMDSERLILPAFLQDIGKFILSNIIQEKGLKDEFIKMLQSEKEVKTVEKHFLQTSTSEVTATIFEYWGLDKELIGDIKYVDSLENSPEEHRKYSQVLLITKKVCNIVKELDETIIEDVLQNAQDFSLDTEVLKESIEVLRNA